MYAGEIDLERALRVYLVADPDQSEHEIVDAVRASVRGGATMVQLRAKRVTDRELIELGERLLEVCAPVGVPLIINDRVDVALAIGAGGVHLGVDDLPLTSARSLAPQPFVIGYSPETDEQATAAEARGASYLGVGPVFGTMSKTDAGEPIGLALLAHRATVSRLPTIGIGGIAAANASSVVEAGACGVAVIGAILRSDDPEAAARALREAVDVALERRRD